MHALENDDGLTFEPASPLFLAAADRLRFQDGALVVLRDGRARHALVGLPRPGLPRAHARGDADGHAPGGPPQVLVAFEADAHGVEPASGPIAAGARDIAEGTVPRY
ncbi:hypothetical protein ACIO8G_00800 [Streptomyces sp. NPDC087219]|uniref:hypothetical protein n=1 Tax=Streptomyces sp. NPDC087219 TaxID=3365770 RepID=UPI0037FB94B8